MEPTSLATFRALGLGLLLAAAVGAQDSGLGIPKPQQPTPGPVVDKDRPGKLKLPGKVEGQEPVEPEEGAAKGKDHPLLAELPADRPALRSFVEALLSSEKIGTQEYLAMFELLDQGDMARMKLLLRKLPLWAEARLCQVYAVHEQGKLVLPLFLARLRQVTYGRYTGSVVESVLLMSGGQAIPVGLELLSSSKAQVRAAAVDSLRKRQSLLTVEQLLPILEDDSKSTRAAACELMIDVLASRPEASVQPLVDCLFHQDGQVRTLAAKGLGDLMPRPLEGLLAIVGRPADEEGWYLATMLVALREMLAGKDLLSAKVVDSLEAVPPSAPALTRAVSAVVRGMRLYRTPELQQARQRSIDGSTPKDLIEDLLDAFDAKRWFPEYPVCHEACQGMLTLLTGQAFGADQVRWRAWWEKARTDFVPFCHQVRLGEDNLAQARLVYVVQGRVELCILASAAPEPQGSDQALRIRLEDDAFAQLDESLKARGFLDLEARYEARKGTSADRVLRVEVDGTRSQDVFRGAEEPRLLRLLGLLDRVRAEQLWQQFLPPDLSGDELRAEWRRNAAALAGLEGRDRQLHVLELCVSSLAKLEGDRRRPALGWLIEQARTEPALLDGRPGDELLALAADRSFPPADAQVLLEALAPGAGEQRFGRMLEILSERGDLELVTSVPKLVALSDPERLLQVLRHEDPDLRAIGAAQAAVLRHPRANELLLGLLADEQAFVRAAAAQSCGRLLLAQARPKLLALATEGNPVVRQAALLSLAQLGGPEVLRALAQGTADAELGVRVAAIRGLAVLGGLEAAKVLLDIAEAHFPEDLSLYALQGLSERGGGALRSEVRRRMTRQIPSTLQMELTFLLGEMQDPDPSVFEKVLAEFKLGRSSSRCCRILAGISGRDFCGRPDRAQRYDDWFRVERDRGQAQWFLSALRDEGTRTTLTDSDLIGGTKLATQLELCRLLEEVTPWQLKALAAHFLREQTGEDYGTVKPDTSTGAVTAMAERYRSFAQAKNAVGGR
ncbi:MAG: HEAT repeat domain-containing protein [Planctomycetota bacterium]